MAVVDADDGETRLMGLSGFLYKIRARVSRMS
jgi:hypothetical protein